MHISANAGVETHVFMFEIFKALNIRLKSSNVSFDKLNNVLPQINPK